jgi:hypothetical protein
MIGQYNHIGVVRLDCVMDENLTLRTELSPGAGTEFEHRVALGRQQVG